MPRRGRRASCRRGVEDGELATVGSVGLDEGGIRVKEE